MEISHRAEQGLRLVVELATQRSAGTNVVRRDVLRRATGLTSATMDEVLRGLRTRGLLHSHRGRDGGWSLAREPSTMSVADVVSAVDGPLCRVAGVVHPPDGSASDPYGRLWLALAASVSDALGSVSVADLADATTRVTGDR